MADTPHLIGLSRPSKKSPALTIQFSGEPTDQQFEEVWDWLKARYSRPRKTEEKA